MFPFFFLRQILRLKDAYASYCGRKFDERLFREAFGSSDPSTKRYIGLLGARADASLVAFVAEKTGMRVENLTCIGTRRIPLPAGSGNDMWESYSSALLSQIPCPRMDRDGGRSALYRDPYLAGIVYHAMKFCDFSQMQYQEDADCFAVPSVRIETDYTTQSEGQLATRLEAFRETMGKREEKTMSKDGSYVAGIDSGSTSTDVVIMDRERKIVASVIFPTGAGRSSAAMKR